jgi:hypothetical protein
MAMVDGFWLMDYHRRFMFDGSWLMVNGFWLMVYFIFCSQEVSMNILPELSDGLNLLLDALVKSSFVIEKQPPQVTRKNNQKYLSF